MRPSSPETPNRGRSRVGGRRSTWPWQNCSSQFNCAQLTYLLVDPLDVPAPLAIAQQQGLRAFIAVDQDLRPGGASRLGSPCPSGGWAPSLRGECPQLGVPPPLVDRPWPGPPGQPAVTGGQERSDPGINTARCGQPRRVR